MRRLAVLFLVLFMLLGLLMPALATRAKPSVIFELSDTVNALDTITANFELIGYSSDEYYVAGEWIITDSKGEVEEYNIGNYTKGTDSLKVETGSSGVLKFKFYDLNSDDVVVVNSDPFTIVGAPDHLRGKIDFGPTQVKIGETVTLSWKLTGGYPPYIFAYYGGIATAITGGNAPYYLPGQEVNSESYEASGSIDFTPRHRGQYGRLLFMFNYVDSHGNGPGEFRWGERWGLIEEDDNPIEVQFDISDPAHMDQPITASWQISGGVPPYEVEAWWRFYDEQNKLVEHYQFGEFRNYWFERSSAATGQSSITPHRGLWGKFNFSVTDSTGRELYPDIITNFDIEGTCQHLPLSAEWLPGPDQVAEDEPLVFDWKITGGIPPFEQRYIVRPEQTDEGGSAYDLRGYPESEERSLSIQPHGIERKIVELVITDSGGGRVVISKPFEVLFNEKKLRVSASLDSSALSEGKLTGSWQVAGGTPPYEVTLIWAEQHFAAENDPYYTYNGEEIVNSATGSVAYEYDPFFTLPHKLAFWTRVTDAAGDKVSSEVESPPLEGIYVPPTPTPQPTPKPTPRPIIPGDANDDQKVDLADLTCLIDHLTETRECDNTDNADANQDTEIDVADALWLIDYLID